MALKSDGPSKRFVIQSTGPSNEHARYYFSINRASLLRSGPSLKIRVRVARSTISCANKTAHSPPASRAVISAADSFTVYRIDGPRISARAVRVSRSGKSDCKPEIATVPDFKLAAKIHDVHMVVCESRISAPVESDYLAGVQLYSGDVALRQPASDSDTHWSQAFGHDVFAELDKDSAKVNLLTVPICDDTLVSNAHSQQVQVRFCTSALKVEPGLNDTAVAFAPRHGSHARCPGPPKRLYARKYAQDCRVIG